MKKILIILGVLILIILGLGIYKFNFTNDDIYINNAKPINLHDGTYIIAGQKVVLKNGISEVSTASDSVSKIVTKYFGNDLDYDLNGDGREDKVFILTQETGGSGTFYYVVALLDTANGLIGSDGVLLGDRIVPKTINLDEGETSQGTNRKNVIVVNYADRKSGESFLIAPSVEKSIWLKLDPTKMQFGEVVQNFEGEVTNLPFLNSGVEGVISIGPICPVESLPPDPNCADKPYVTSIQVISIGSPKSSPFTTGKSDKNGKYKIMLPPGEYALQPVGGSVMPRCETKNITIEPSKIIKVNISCDSGIR